MHRLTVRRRQEGNTTPTKLSMQITRQTVITTMKNKTTPINFPAVQRSVNPRANRKKHFCRCIVSCTQQPVVLTINIHNSGFVHKHRSSSGRRFYPQPHRPAQQKPPPAWTESDVMGARWEVVDTSVKECAWVGTRARLGRQMTPTECDFIYRLPVLISMMVGAISRNKRIHTHRQHS